MPAQKRRGVRKITFSGDSVTSNADEPTPGPSGVQFRPKSLADDLKAARLSKEQDKKYRARLNADQRKLLAQMRAKKQVGNFLMPDSPQRKKGKRRDNSTTETRIPCPLGLGVPAVPPPRIPPAWEVQGSHETIVVASSSASSSADIHDPSSFIGRTVEDDDNDVIEGTPPQKCRKYGFTPLLGVIQVTTPPVDHVWADIELIGFTPQSTISKTTPGSGASNVSYEIDVEHDFVQSDSGSEIEIDNNFVDIGSRNDIFDVVEALDDPVLAVNMDDIGAEADSALRAMVDPNNGDVFFFDWHGDINHFQGIREEFTGPSGPTFDVCGLSPLEVFRKIWDTDIIDQIVRETNRYAHQTLDKNISFNSRMYRWKDTTGEEIWRFFTIIMLQSLVINNVEREYWYPNNDQVKIGNFEKIMGYNRFLLLKKCLHFVDNTASENSSKLSKVMPIIKHLNNKFSTLYLPGQNVAIDESLLLWKGRLSFAQLIATKKARVGIKSYELCESRTGYLWRMEVYSGKAPLEAIELHDPADESESATSQIVYRLMRPLFGKGHTIIMDNFYNAPLLSRLLKKNHKTDTMGTLRLNREFVPEALKCKTKKTMEAGEVCFSCTNDLSVVVWKDKNLVPMISTFHHPEVGGKEKYGYYRYKPRVVLDYNLYMGGVDHKDQMLHAFPIERVRNQCWYKKLFRRLLNVSVHNAFVIFNHDRTQQTKVGNRDFRMRLVREMMQAYKPPEQPDCVKLPPPRKLNNMHLPIKNVKGQRCKWCNLNERRRTTMYRCSSCDVNLCIEDCYTVYHEEFYVNAE